MFQINQILENVEIIAIANGGEGICRVENIVIFVKYSAIGDVLDVKITEISKKFARAEILRIKKPSNDRIEPSCKYYTECGGCNFMHLKYEKQLEYKEYLVKNALKKIGNILETEYVWQGIQSSPKEFYYRNKLQVPVDGKLIGFYCPKSHNVVDIKTCLIQPKILDEILLKIREFDTGDFRHICMRINKNNEIILAFVVKKITQQIRKTAQEIFDGFENVKGVLLNENKDMKNNFVFGSDDFELVCGEDKIFERLGNIEYEISSNSFFQVNTDVGEKMYQYLKENLSKDENVLDLYCGSGGISLFIADSVKSVVGIEVVEKAVLNAKKSALKNSIKNVEFFCGSVEEYISGLSSRTNVRDLKISPPMRTSFEWGRNDKESVILSEVKNLKKDVLILNPPRKGASEKVLNDILRIKPKKIIYVSCEPTTLARDLKKLRENGYKIESIKSFDMFPQTSNVESVVKMFY